MTKRSAWGLARRYPAMRASRRRPARGRLAGATRSPGRNVGSPGETRLAAKRNGPSQKPTVPIAVVMIARNEAHNMEGVLANLEGFAEEVFLVDSGSDDGMAEIACSRGATVVEHPFSGFGAQWNFALDTLPIGALWTMKLDPDERLTDEAKVAIARAIADGKLDGFALRRRLWFLGRPLAVKQTVIRGWRTGRCRFSDVSVNEHPLVAGRVRLIEGLIEHHDSPSLHHWLDKQNRYTSMEAEARLSAAPLSAVPRLSGTALERRMWLKANFSRLPLRYGFLHLYNLFFTGAWRSGRAGRAWARLRTEVHRQIELKCLEEAMRSHDVATTGEKAARR